MNERWREVVLTCPACRLAVVTSVDALLAGDGVICLRGHLLPVGDLSCSGLRETVDAFDGLIEQIERHEKPSPPTPLPSRRERGAAREPWQFTPLLPQRGVPSGSRGRG